MGQPATFLLRRRTGSSNTNQGTQPEAAWRDTWLHKPHKGPSWISLAQAVAHGRGGGGGEASVSANSVATLL